VVGAGSTYAVDATGGSADAIVVTHNHTATSAVTDPGHSHSFSSALILGTTTDGVTGTVSGGGNAGALTIVSNTTGITVATTINNSGNSGTNANLPPYYALCYIMKT